MKKKLYNLALNTIMVLLIIILDVTASILIFAGKIGARVEKLCYKIVDWGIERQK